MTSSLSRSIALAVAIAFAGGPALAQSKKGGKKATTTATTKDTKAQTGAQKTTGPAQTEAKKERKGPAKYNINEKYKLGDAQKEALADKKRDESIDQLKKIIPKFEDGAEQKAELLFQLSELYWEKSQYLYRKEMKKLEDDQVAYEAALNKGEKGLKEPKEDHRESELFRSETMRLYETILREYPSYQRKDEVLFSLGYNQYEIGKKDAAVKRYQELIKNYPTSKFVPDAYVQLGNHFFEANNLAEAETNFKKAYATKIPKISSYALYKLGWCDYNAGRIEEGLKKLQDVVSFADAQGKQFVDLKNEALNDSVLFFVQLDRVDDGINYFKAKAGKKKQPKLVARLSYGLADAGHHESAIKGFRYLINDQPMGAAAPEYQQAIVKSYEGLRQRELVKAEIKKLVDLYAPGSQWWKANESQKSIIRNAFSLTEEAMRTMVTDYHAEAQKTKSVATYKLARDIYKQYVDAFASSSDENFISDQAFNLRFFYAEILWSLEDWEEAAKQYDAVVAFKIPNRDTAKEASNENYRKLAAYNSVLTYGKLLDIERGVVSKTQLDESKTIDENKKKGVVAKQKAVKRQKLSEDQMKEKPLTKIEDKLVAACDRYNQMFPNNPDEIELRYQAAVILFDKSHFVDAAKRFGEVILKWPEERRSQDAADLTMSVLEDKEEWLELNKLARAFLGNKKLSKPNTEFTKRVAGVVEGSQYKWVDEVVYKKEKNPARAAEEFLKFVEEFPRSENADRALTYAMIIFQEANQIDRGIEQGERVLKDYPGSVFELKVRYTLAVFYEKTADFEKSANMYEAFIDTYDRLKDPKKYAEEQKKKLAEAKKAEAAAKKDKKAVAKADPKAKKDAGKAGASDRKINPEELKAQLADADKWIADAQFNAALWWEGLGKSDKAIAAYGAYMTRFKDKKDVPEIAFNIAEIQEKDGKHAEALKAFEDFNVKYAKDPRATASLHYQSKYKQYLLQLKAKNQKDADKLQDELIKGFAKLSAEEKQNLDNLNAFGHARFNALEPQWKAYTDIKFTKVATIKNDFKLKQTKMAAVEKMYTEVLAIGAGEWGIAALTRIGQGYADFANNIRKSPDPKGLDEDQLDMYRSELENLTLPLEDKAVEALEKALAKAYELNIYNEWTLAGQDKINEYRRGYYGDLKQVGFQGSEFFATMPVLKDAGTATAKAEPKPEKKTEEKPAPKEQTPGTKTTDASASAGQP